MRLGALDTWCNCIAVSCDSRCEGKCDVFAYHRSTPAMAICFYVTLLASELCCSLAQALSRKIFCLPQWRVTIACRVLVGPAGRWQRGNVGDLRSVTCAREGFRYIVADSVSMPDMCTASLRYRSKVQRPLTLDSTCVNVEQ